MFGKKLFENNDSNGIDVENIVNNALKIAKNGSSLNTVSSFTKIVNGKVVEATSKDIEDFDKEFGNMFGDDDDDDDDDYDCAGGSNISFNVNKPEARELVDAIVECPGCGARNVIQKGQIGTCEYCDSKLSV